MPLPPFLLADCGVDAVPPVSPPAFQSLPCQIQMGEETPPVAAAQWGERRPSATFVFPNRRLEDVPGMLRFRNSTLSGIF